LQLEYKRVKSQCAVRDSINQSAATCATESVMEMQGVGFQ